MAEDKKKNGILKFVKRQMSQNINVQAGNDEDPENMPVELRSPVSKNTPTNAKPRARTVQLPSYNDPRASFAGMNDLIQCPLCLDKFVNPKMLPCQHTFCLKCLYTQVKDNVILCRSCNKKFPLISPDYLEKLPSNLYVDMFIRQISSTPNPVMIDRPVSFMPTSVIQQKRCAQCKSIIDKEHNCQHCQQIFCAICWSAHMSDLKSQISPLLNEIKEGSKRLNHRLESYKDRNEWLVNKIKSTAENKIIEIKEKQQALMKESSEILAQGETSAKSLQAQLNEMQKTVEEYLSNENVTQKTDNEKVNAFMNFHQMAVSLLNDIANWGETKYSLDEEKYCIEKDFEGPADVDTDEPAIVEVKGVENPLESSTKMILYYRSRNFTPRMIWKKCPRPAGVGVAPWSDNLYVCSTDSHTLIIMDKVKGKLIERISHPAMLCPQNIAFSQRRSEIYISDKWAHCIHVLSKTGEYLRTIGSKGNKEGCMNSPEGISVEPNEIYLYVCDTGNDRIQVFHIETGSFMNFIGIYSPAGKSVQITQLNGPTAIATTPDRIIISDSGNKRIKIFSYNGEKQREFGCPGYHKGQFQHPEIMTVDPLGFILVGDCGNARVQIFEPNGQLLRVFGGRGREPGHFGWISGMCVTPQLEIVVSDTKNHCVNIF